MHYNVLCVYLGNWESLQPIMMEVSDSDRIEDVWDGSVLQQLSLPGQYFSLKGNLALSLFTDGIPVFKSSLVSMWPVYLVIQNLPLTIRGNAENVILCALWVGPSKPPMSLLLTPVVESIQDLDVSGLTIKTKLVFAVFDLPAKAAVLCAKQYNVQGYICHAQCIRKEHTLG